MQYAADKDHSISQVINAVSQTNEHSCSTVAAVIQKEAKPTIKQCMYKTLLDKFSICVYTENSSSLWRFVLFVYMWSQQ